MDRPARSQHSQEPPDGEYVVVFERPYPRRLERMARYAATTIGFACGALVFWAFETRGMQTLNHASFAALGGLSAMIAFVALYGAGILAIEVYTRFRVAPQHTVEWQNTADPSGERRQRFIIGAFVLTFMTLLFIASH